ncbi:MAG: propionyl-CoA carboxylase [PS1 clade bacterium]|nr:propionyl-CoA carboxylase [PS1 clade bacterium]
MSWEKDIDEIKRRRDLAKQQGGSASVARQHEKGRLTIRERIDGLLDDGSFNEVGEGAGVPEYDDTGALTDFQPANFVLGFGDIDGRRVIVGGEDFTLKGGSPNPAGLRKSVYAEQLALKYKVPLIRLHEGGGGSVGGTGQEKNRRPLGEPVFSTSRFVPLAQTLGHVPVATAALGPVAGLPAARLVASHFSVMTEDAAVLIAGPQVVKRALGHDMTKEELGGPQVHLKSGAIDNLASSEEDALNQIARFLSYVPDNAWQRPARKSCTDPIDRCEDALANIVPTERRQPFQMRKVITHVVDHEAEGASSFFEMSRKFGPSLITGLARMNGHAVGVIGNDCMFYAGAMTAAAAQKLRRFIDFCNSFHLPVLSFVDEPGFMIGPDSEAAGTIRHGTAAISAVLQSRVPWASIQVQKAFGVAAQAHFGPDAYVLSWPSAASGALPVEGGVAVAFAREIAAADDPAARQKELEDMLAASQSPFPRAEGFSVHEIIDPRETRPKLAAWLDIAQAAQTDAPTPFSATMRP